jgi:hypothetical protein
MLDLPHEDKPTGVYKLHEKDPDYSRRTGHFYTVDIEVLSSFNYVLNYSVEVYYVNGDVQLNY